MKNYKITHESGLTCELKAKDEVELKRKLSSGFYGVLPIRGNFIRLTPENIAHVQEIIEG